MYDNNGFYANENKENNNRSTGAYSNYYNHNYGTAYTSYREQTEKKKSGFGVKAVTFALCGALFGVFAGAGFYGVNLLNNHMVKEEIVVSTPVVEEAVKPIPQVQYGENKIISSPI